MRAIETVYLHVTSACNLRCLYCFLGTWRSTESELSTNEILSVLRDVNLLNPHRVVFTGGEPLLRHDIIALASSLRAMGYDRKVCLATNGTLIHSRNVTELLGSFSEIRISIDGFRGVNDEMRGRGTFEKAIKSFGCILSAGGSPVASVTVTSSTLPDLKEFMRFLFRSGIVRIHISPASLAGRADNPNMICEFADIRRIVDEFWHEAFGFHLVSQRKYPNSCGVGRFITLYPDGSVYPCHLLAYPEFCLGNVRTQSLYRIYHESSIMKKLESLDFAGGDQCVSCLHESQCERGCLGTSARKGIVRKGILSLLAGAEHTGGADPRTSGGTP